MDGELKFKISEILNSKVDQHHKTCKLLYLVCLSGYEGTDKETSWLLAMELGNAMELLEDYHVWYPDKPRPLTSM